LNKTKREEIFKILSKVRPKPETELIYSSCFELLIAVILSAQTTDIAVNKITYKLFKKLRTPQSFIKFGEKKLKEELKTIGLYRNKASNILKTCKIIIENFDSKVPENRSKLESLPGVGRKTANVILNTYFGWETIAVDTHVYRVSNRTKLATGDSVLEVEKKLDKYVPKKFKRYAHHWLILHGRYTCIARKPKCYKCEIKTLCEYKIKNL